MANDAGGTMLNKEYPDRSWTCAESAWFRRPSDPFGRFHNFCVEMPFAVHRVDLLTSEHLYQALRFPHLPEVQLQILCSPTPKGCKLIAREHDARTREDWLDVRVDVMRWVVACRVIAYPNTLGDLLRATEQMPIVEYSKRDQFWGAGPVDGDCERLQGQNVLGCLIGEIREVWLQDPALERLRTPRFADALLLQEQLTAHCVPSCRESFGERREPPACCDPESCDHVDETNGC